MGKEGREGDKREEAKGGRKKGGVVGKNGRMEKERKFHPPAIFKSRRLWQQQ